MEGQTVARISVKDRLGPLPNDTASGRSSSFKRRRGRNESVERNPRRGRKIPKKQQEGTDSPKKNTGAPRIPVHERLGVLPQQAFKKSDGQLFHKRNRQQVWRHEGNFQPEQTVAVQESKEMIPEVENKPPFVNPKPAPVVKPFNAEQHRQTWTWVRPSTTSNSNSSAAAMDIDESIENAN